VQSVLDIAGFVPGVGELADATNAAISLGRGDYVGAALSCISLLPIAGDWAFRFPLSHRWDRAVG
jgi:hypothetical protein